MTTVSPFGYCLCVVVAFTEVASWTIDLQEVRRYFDEKLKHDEYQRHLNNYYGDIYDDYETVMDGQHGNQYAEEYGYDTYMEKKVHGIVRNGTRYLEGLKLAIENYKQTIENCSRIDFKTFEGNSNTTVVPGVRWNSTSPELPWNSSWVQGLSSNPDWPRILNSSANLIPALNTSSNSVPGSNFNSTWRPALEEPIRNLTDADFERIRCANATKEREHVRRLADLALWTTSELQDRAMLGGHGGHHSNGDEEKELLIRLAWFLDRLAHITGYEPDANNFVDNSETPPNPLAISVPEDVKIAMMDCIRQNSSQPATERCAFPVQLPPLLRMALNLTDDNDTVPVDSSTVLDATSELPTDSSMLPEITASSPPVLPEPSDQAPKSLESLLQVSALSKLPPLSRAVKSVRKRSADDPVLKVMKYYGKQKIWVGSNPEVSETEINKHNFNVDNNLPKLKYIPKRSTVAKRAMVVRIPEDPYQDISDYVKHGVSYRTDKKQEGNIRKFLEMRKINSQAAKMNVRKPEKSIKSVGKRSVKYDKMTPIHNSEDPTQDISYYVKNKPGTNVNPSVVGALEARLALERIFQTGNIEVVRRYGSNYNPLIPSPYYFGILKTIADI